MELLYCRAHTVLHIFVKSGLSCRLFVRLPFDIDERACRAMLTHFRRLILLIHLTGRYSHIHATQLSARDGDCIGFPSCATICFTVAGVELSTTSTSVQRRMGWSCVVLFGAPCGRIVYQTTM